MRYGNSLEVAASTAISRAVARTAKSRTVACTAISRTVVRRAARAVVHIGTAVVYARCTVVYS